MTRKTFPLSDSVWAPPSHATTRRRGHALFSTFDTRLRDVASLCPLLKHTKMANRPIHTLALPAATLAALTRAGYETVKDIAGSTPEQLASGKLSHRNPLDQPAEQYFQMRRYQYLHPRRCSPQPRPRRPRHSRNPLPQWFNKLL